jgi:hypothetical protein
MITPDRLAWLIADGAPRMEALADDSEEAWNWLMQYYRLAVLLQTWRLEGRGWENALDGDVLLGCGLRRPLAAALASLRRLGIVQLRVVRRGGQKVLQVRLAEDPKRTEREEDYAAKLFDWLDAHTDFPAELPGELPAD